MHECQVAFLRVPNPNEKSHLLEVTVFSIINFGQKSSYLMSGDQIYQIYQKGVTIGGNSLKSSSKLLG